MMDTEHKQSPNFLYFTAIGSLLIAAGIIALLHWEELPAYIMMITGCVLNFVAVMWGLKQEGYLEGKS